MEKQENANALKHLFDQSLLKRMAKSLSKVDANFKSQALIGLFPKMQSLEMKERVRLIRDELHRQLPASYPKALAILLKSLKTGDLNGFDLWPYSEYIQTHGLEHVDLSLNALRQMTPVFTSEWAVRPFIRLFPQKTLAFLKKCADHPDVNVRRWASEGSRPRLPWGERLQDLIRDPRPTRPILEKLKFDSELFVRKSVANHLNDISKDHPDFVFDLLSEWQKMAAPEDERNLQWIVRHALRTAIKNGHPRALKLIGVSGKALVQMKNLSLEKSKIRMGESLSFSFEIHSQTKKPQKLVVDYVLHFRKAKGQTAPKVFKLKTCTLMTDQPLHFTKKHSIKEITTRVYYTGAQSLSIQVNGVILGELTWTLA